MAEVPALAQRGLKNPPDRPAVSALPVAEALRTELGGALAEQPEASWRAALEQTADRLLSAQAIR
jgi:hypothetical protein